MPFETSIPCLCLFRGVVIKEEIVGGRGGVVVRLCWFINRWKGRPGPRGVQHGGREDIPGIDVYDFVYCRGKQRGPCFCSSCCFSSANFMPGATTKKCLDMRYVVQLDYPINFRTSALARVILGTTARGHDTVTYSG